ncbi:D-alanyl-D-alanine-carboxypeptidase/D-alanyl-D-alanine-endopeptidase [Pedobacter sp. W3I1]|uniref:serine hydrolase domain-containing protein n=1 Tax=Pedobacter sp. W3I1 TaxID=3042291 RepID=UPI0027823F4C|nr:serine hydrolase domain-containing protein [Pedobacter sp. W3I1]MDQ0638965.1 D-alanyl-D-alanine-carboxypeptidase/D-alanyl-D-alanine-endopeptidase [Pedobacter sp. W3I1]
MRKLFQSIRLKKRGLASQGFYILAIILSFSSSLMAQQLRRIDGTTISTDSLNHYLPLLMEKAHVMGLGIAIFNQNKVVYKNTFGYADGVKKTTLKPTANFYGASLSKCIFTMMVMKLVEQGKLDLDKPLQQYLPKPIYEYKKQTRWHDDYSSLKNDPLYQKITARMCLDHTTGFPNWRWDVADQKLKVMQEPGSRYSYSGEGMVYLQVVIEKMTGKSLEQLADEIVFGPLNMKNSAYTFLPAFEKDYILGHDAKGKAYEKDKDNEARSPSTLETTFDDMTLFVEGLMQKKVINNRTTNEIFSPQIAIHSVEQMGPLSRKDTSANDNISLSYGLGFGLLKSPYGWGAFKEGHGDGFQHYMILFPKQKIGVLIMTNSDNGESIFKELLALSIADKYTPWKWQRYFPYDSGTAKEQ